jgi:hypothetical protein
LAPLAVAAVVTIACQTSVVVWTERPVVARPEPAAAASFVAAYGAGDETTAERSASPLYAAEWARRGIAATDRTSLRAPVVGADRRPTPLSFQYVNGAVEPDGVAHLLYLVRPTGSTGSPTVWRVDTDARGQVIWAEMVWLFSEGATRVAPVSDPGALGSLPLPDEVARLRPRLAVGLRAAGASEGYYALEVDAPAPDGHRAELLFMAVDEAGRARPGVWSYGQAEAGLREHAARG